MPAPEKCLLPRSSGAFEAPSPSGRDGLAGNSSGFSHPPSSLVSGWGGFTEPFKILVKSRRFRPGALRFPDPGSESCILRLRLREGKNLLKYASSAIRMTKRTGDKEPSAPARGLDVVLQNEQFVAMET